MYISALIRHIQNLPLFGDWQIYIDSISDDGLMKIHRRFCSSEIFLSMRSYQCWEIQIKNGPLVGNVPQYSIHTEISKYSFPNSFQHILFVAFNLYENSAKKG